MIDIQPMTLEHLDAVYDIEVNSFAVPWTKSSLRGEITDSRHKYYYVALNEAQVVGYAGMWHIVNEGHINNIAVAPHFRQRGVGKRLMERLLLTGIQLEMIGLTLEVRIGNRAAMGLYHQYGFKMEGIRKNYYADTKEDAVIMWMRFEEANERVAELINEVRAWNQGITN